MLNRSLENYLQMALGHAKHLGHASMGTEHLLKAVLEAPWIQDWLKSQKIDWKASLLSPLDNFLNQCAGGKRESFRIPWSAPIPNFQSKQALSRASAIGRSCQKSDAAPLYLLVAIWAGDSGFAGELVRQSSLGLDSILEFLSRVQRVEVSFPNLNASKRKGTPAIEPFAPLENWGEEEVSALERGWMVNLTEQAALGMLEPMVGRDRDLERTLQILGRKKKCNPMLLGEAGVGKTTLIEGLAIRLLSPQKLPRTLIGSRVYALDLPALLSGTKYRGDLEKRFKGLMRDLSAMPKAILAIDEIHLLIGAGNSSGGQIDLASLFKPLLAKDQFKVIGATTVQEFQNTFEKDKALSRRFQKVLIREPSRLEAFQIIKGLKPVYEAHHNVRYTNEVIEEAVALASEYIHDRALPDKALDLIDELGAAWSQSGLGRRSLKATDLKPVLNQLFQRPVWGPFADVKIDFKALEAHLNQNILGQDEAIRGLVRLLQGSCSGAWRHHSAPVRPLASVLLVGPTGVGKTFCPKLLSKFLGLSLVRLDMSEYAEPHAISRLLGAPPGYVGHESGSTLVQKLREHPQAILLFDEIEKAHPDLLYSLLQILDEGTFTDHQGRKVTFQHSLLIFTSNLGFDGLYGQAPGFHKDDVEVQVQKRLAERLPTELRSRLDRVIIFSPLERSTLRALLQQELARWHPQMKAAELLLEIQPEVAERWVEQAFTMKLGARGLLHILQQELAEAAVKAAELPKGGSRALQVGSRETPSPFQRGASRCVESGTTLSSNP